jgi:hypothetical protein
MRETSVEESLNPVDSQASTPLCGSGRRCSDLLWRDYGGAVRWSPRQCSECCLLSSRLGMSFLYLLAHLHPVYQSVLCPSAHAMWVNSTNTAVLHRVSSRPPPAGDLGRLLATLGFPVEVSGAVVSPVLSCEYLLYRQGGTGGCVDHYAESMLGLTNPEYSNF